MIKRVSHRTALGAVALLVAAGCSISPNGGGNGGGPGRPGVPEEARKGCDVYPQPPKLETYPVGLRLVGWAIAECDVVPPEHLMEVWLEERLPGGVWSPVENEMLQLSTKCTALPAPGIPVSCEHVVQCFPGHYRSVVTVHWVDQFGPGVWSPPEKPDKRIDCPL